MAVERNKIVNFCEEYLKTQDFEDYCHNGLQVEGAEKVEKVVTGVSLSQKLIEAAIEKKAQMIIVHHGIFKSMLEDRQIKGVFKNRIKLLLQNDINLLGFHLPLDSHPEIGNNISLCNLLGIVNNVKSFDVGFIGELANEIKFSEFVNLINSKLNVQAAGFNTGNQIVKKVAVISGGAAADYELAADAGADTFLCGDIREEVVRGIEEKKINFINAGHYNTEKLGIQNLGEVIAKEFDIDVEFVDIPNNV